MKINKVASSEVFDIYSNVMSKYLKKTAGAAGDLLGEGADLAKTVMKDLAPSADEAGTAAAAAAAKATSSVPGKVVYSTVKQVNDSWKEMFPNNTIIRLTMADSFLHNLVSGTNPMFTSSPKYTATWNSPERLMEIIKEGRNWITKIKRFSKQMDGSSAPELISFFKGTLEDMTGNLQKVSRRHQELILAAQRNKSQVPNAGKAVSGEAAEVVGGEAAEVVSEEAVKAVGGEATEAVSEKAGRAVSSEAAEVVSEEATEGVVNSVGTESVKTAVKEITKVTGGRASDAVTVEANALSNSARNLGTAEGTVEVVSKAEATEPAAGPLKESLKESVKDMKVELSEDIAKATNKIAAEAGAEIASQNKKITAIQDELTRMVQGVRQSAKDTVKADAAKAGGGKAAAGLSDSLKGAAKEGATKWVKSLFSTGKIAGKAWGAIKIVGIIAAGTLALGGVAAIGLHLMQDDEREAFYQLEVNKLNQAIANATATHRVLRFKDSTNGLVHNQELLQELADNKNSASLITIDAFEDSSKLNSLMMAMDQIDELNVEVSEFTRANSQIVGDLESPSGWDEALLADAELIKAITGLKVVLRGAISGAIDNGIATPQGRSREESSGRESPYASGPISPDEDRMTINVYEEEIDITNKPAGFRSSAKRMVRKLLNNPYGMAFVDPDNRWGGFIRKTGNPQVDYLNSLGYLYKENIFTPSQLRKFIRRSIPREGRRRHSGWKNAVKYYRKNPVSNKTASNLVINNVNGVSSTNSSYIGMRKMADQYSNKYISDAISDLSDQYAKSYYAGLKSMYNPKKAPHEADYKALYEVHKGKGSDLIHEAHPDAVVVSDAMGNGGLVENLLEQKSHSEGVAKSAPTGNFRGKHAKLEVIEALTKIAEKADKDGYFEVSDLISSTINTILKK